MKSRSGLQKLFLVATSIAALFFQAVARADSYHSPVADLSSIAFKETPSLLDQVASGKLPPVAERLPLTPFVVKQSHSWEPGKHGGTINSLIGKAKDVRLFVVYGYARLVGYTPELEFTPDILEKMEVEDGRIFTMTLRKGHKWSDGAPFTSEDFRYFWEDVANNAELQPFGPPAELIIDGHLPTVEIIDEITVRYSWPVPNPFFLPQLASTAPLFIYQPAHYMKQFHARYNPPEELEKKVQKADARNWVQLHNRRARQYKYTNPKLPSLQPWINTVKPPSTRFVGVRNPFYHRIDELGQQLPYADEMVLSVAGGGLIPAKVGSGDANIQARELSFSDYTFLKRGEKQNNYLVRLWKTVRGSHYALYPNLNVNDPGWRALNRDKRFRHALSLAVNRRELNQVLFYGLGLEGNNNVLPDSTLYKEDYFKRWTSFDLKQANLLLDEIGLTSRNDEGLRLLPDGRPMQIIVETAGESSEEIDALELIHDSWLKIGIKIYPKPSQREVLRNRIFAGETILSLWFGNQNALLTPHSSPEEFTPRMQQSFQWPKWGQFVETKGNAGEEVDIPEALELNNLYVLWLKSHSSAEKRAIWNRILEISSEETFSIGLVAEIPQPVVLSANLKNLPLEGFYNWEPGSLFGVYKPDGFWFE
ncbi:ABC transporter substrate-binding protein [Kiloniella laminariae]|uniref:ABC transporter substrate-binding protein n=1 Tax=Kiloniella laminariae TaxID=454162 RepID=A0ABT4LPN1_9PROT|nr:ABC transporter substrate-binding protein [Kiloniella laminariae]MCZ4281907.1 ABC transporter substrate-binding protein [Kiloniella laminariae]